MPCLAIGNSDIDTFADKKGEITGICFQKVDEGEVKPCLESCTFQPVDWPNAPTRPQPQPAVINFVRPNPEPKQKWRQFANFVLHLRNALLSQVNMW